MINIKNIEVFYQKKIVLNQVSLDVNKGDFVFILGPNGAGKSTLLKSINGILKTKKGNIFIHQKPIGEYSEIEIARQIAYIPQELNMQFDYTVYEFILMARFPWLSYWGHYQNKDHVIVEKYLDLMGLQLFKDRLFNQLSGGEKQRVLIARALVQETEYILMDESLSFLDINHQIEILILLKNINLSENKTIIMVSHNLNLAAEFADKLIFLKNGTIFAQGSVAEVYNEEILSNIFDTKISMMKNPFTLVGNIVYNPN
ncbi:MAG: ABC transporter ATP-binding protein [Candidatus Cloacimonetes bacterium]|nr:ABC transporter ATP-binding protein [Candidatus Cloacimonadota bacterium]